MALLDHYRLGPILGEGRVVYVCTEHVWVCVGVCGCVCGCVWVCVGVCGRACTPE